MPDEVVVTVFFLGYAKACKLVYLVQDGFPTWRTAIHLVTPILAVLLSAAIFSLLRTHDLSINAILPPDRADLVQEDNVNSNLVL